MSRAPRAIHTTRAPGPAGIVLLALLACLVALAASAGAPVESTLHLAALTDGDLALAGCGGLYRVTPANGKMRHLAVLDGEVQGLVSSGDSLVVAFGGSEPHLSFFDREGRPRNSWKKLPEMKAVGGLASHGERLFITGVAGYQIYRLETRSKVPSAVARIYGARSVGALARSPRGTFYVADPAQGVVLMASEGARASLPMAEDVGTPVALAVDEARDRLLILDSLDGVIWSVPLEARRDSPGSGADSKRIRVRGISYRTEETARRLARLRDWRSPTALAVTADGSTWWADGGTGVLVKLDANDKELARYPLPWAGPRECREHLDRGLILRRTSPEGAKKPG